MWHRMMGAVAVVAAGTGVAWGSGEAGGAKALFYSGEGVTFHSGTEAAPKKKAQVRTNKGALPARPEARENRYSGISYWVDVVGRDGSLKRTTTNHQFRSGDRIRLNFKSNFSGYIYILNVGSSGTTRQLFPTNNQANYVQAGIMYSFPQDSYLLFDETPGEENLQIVLARQMLDLNLRENPASPKVLFAGAKDLLLEDDTRGTAGGPAQYAVIPASRLDEGKAVAITITLKHR